MVYILHIDTSSDNGLIAIAGDGKIISERRSTESRDYASIINILIDESLAEAGISLKDLSSISVCGGPGSYTGLRIGLSAAKAFCYVLNKPLMMHNRLLLLTLEEYYQHLSKYDFYTTILPAREKEYFISSYNNKLQTIIEPQHVFESELTAHFTSFHGKNVVVGVMNSFTEASFKSLYSDIISQKDINADSWCRYAFEQFNCNGFVTLAHAEPFYLKQVYTHKDNKINGKTK